MFWYSRYDLACGKELLAQGISTFSESGRFVLAYTRSFTNALKRLDLPPKVAANVAVAYVIDALGRGEEPVLSRLLERV